MKAYKLQLTQVLRLNFRHNTISAVTFRWSSKRVTWQCNFFSVIKSLFHLRLMAQYHRNSTYFIFHCVVWQYQNHCHNEFWDIELKEKKFCSASQPIECVTIQLVSVKFHKPYNIYTTTAVRLCGSEAKDCWNNNVSYQRHASNQSGMYDWHLPCSLW
jgi:hypothetical protein